MSTISKAENEQGFVEDTNVSEGDEEDEDNTCLSGVQVLSWLFIKICSKKSDSAVYCEMKLVTGIYEDQKFPEFMFVR